MIGKAWWAFNVLIKGTVLTLVRPVRTSQLQKGRHRLAANA